MQQTRPKADLDPGKRVGVSALADVQRLVELRREKRPGHTDAAFVTYSQECCKLAEAILEQGVEDWLDALVEEMAANCDQITTRNPPKASATVEP